MKKIIILNTDKNYISETIGENYMMKKRILILLIVILIIIPLLTFFFGMKEEDNPEKIITASTPIGNPNISDNKITFVGNTAGSGARLALKSRSIRKIAERIAQKVHYVELGALKEFQREFLDATIIPNRRS